MVFNADSTGVDSTSSTDSRITPLGSFIRRFKIDELTQLINVLLGTMSLVGPRPNVQTEVDLYTKVELSLLSVKPGITDISSIVFSDEGDILSNLTTLILLTTSIYVLIKALWDCFYIEHSSVGLDFQLLFITFLSIFNRRYALLMISRILRSLNAPDDLIIVSSRSQPLMPSPPPGASAVVTTRSPS